MNAAKFLLLCFTLCAHACGQQSRTDLQLGDVKSLPDVTAELQKKIDGDRGNLHLSGDTNYRITAPLVFDLKKLGAVAIRATEGTTIVMDGPGPAIRIIGSHDGTASPKSFQPATWNQRMPIISGLEILGAHPEADGIELVQTVEASLNQVAVRWCRHGVHLVDRNRNVVISDCHLYENSGVGVFLDDVNLHQINISNSHISYNREGGIVVRDGNVRNLQVSGCDIEGNMPADDTSTTAANVLIDVTNSPDDRSKSIAEISITGCTIQHAANYSGKDIDTVAPGGANIRLAGKKSYPINSVTISGNVLSDTTVNVDVSYAHDVAINANNFFAPKPDNLKVANSQRVVVTGNTFNPRQFQRPGTIVFEECDDCIVSSNTLHKFDTDQGALIFRRCNGCIVSSLILTDCGSGIHIEASADLSISNCRIARLATGKTPVKIDSASQRISQNRNSVTFVAE